MCGTGILPVETRSLTVASQFGQTHHISYDESLVSVSEADYTACGYH